MKTFSFGIAVLSAAVVLSGCSSKQEKTIFVDGEKLKADDRIPAVRVWKDPSAVMSKYDKIMIADVRTDLKLDKSWMEHSGMDVIPGEEDKDLKALAVYMKQSFSKAVSEQPCRMKLVNSKGPGTVVLELAIVKVVANKPVLELGSTVGMALIRPISLCLIPVKSVVAHETHSPLSAYLAVEGKIIDAETGKELILFAMNKYEKGALLDINRHVSPYANVREIVDDWGVKLVEAINRRPLETGEKVKNETGVHDYTLIKF